MESTFGAEYLETMEFPMYGGGRTIMCSGGECWQGTIVCPERGPCKFVREGPVDAT